MEISQKLLGLMFTLSVAAGAGLGCILDLIGLLRALTGAGGTVTQARRAEKPRSAGEAVQLILRGTRGTLLFLVDVLFGILCGCVLILLLYYTNDGGFRLLAVIGMAAGFFVWRSTAGRLLAGLFRTAAVRFRMRTEAKRNTKKTRPRKAGDEYERADRT